LPAQLSNTNLEHELAPERRRAMQEYRLMRTNPLQDKDMQVRNTWVRLTGAPVSTRVNVRSVVAAWLIRCRQRAPRPRMRMGSKAVKGGSPSRIGS
jgi:hypothetical protein